MSISTDESEFEQAQAEFLVALNHLRVSRGMRALGEFPVATKQDHCMAVVAILDRYGQRATYAALGGVVGLPARSVMQGHPRSHANSWVVAAKSGLPSGYVESEWHPLLKQHQMIIRSPEALEAWLREHL